MCLQKPYVWQHETEKDKSVCNRKYLRHEGLLCESTEENESVVLEVV